MITRIQVRNFKSLKSVDLKLGWFNLFVGENASGKSNFLEVLRVLQGIGNGYTVSEVFDGKPAGPTNEKWDGIRGGIAGAVYRGRTSAEEDARCITLSVEVSVDIAGQACALEYSISATPGVYPASLFNNETLRESGQVIERATGGFANFPTLRKWKTKKPEACRIALSDCQRLDFATDLLRDYSPGRGVKRIGERGEQFSSLLETIFANELAKQAYLSWLAKLLPSDIDDIQIVHAPKGEALMKVLEGRRELTADLLSDGTLRFAALVAAFFQPEMPKTMLIEEIETGLHPTRIRLLVQLLKRRSRDTGTQVFATTHSPTVLDWLEEADYPSVFLCTRNEETGASVIRPLSEIPRLTELRKEKIPLSELFAEGWLEKAV